jgi:hypothetical protein
MPLLFPFPRPAFLAPRSRRAFVRPSPVSGSTEPLVLEELRVPDMTPAERETLRGESDATSTTSAPSTSSAWLWPPAWGCNG